MVGYQLVVAIRFSSFYLGRGVRERWCVAHPCPLVWENPPWWWYEFKGPRKRVPRTSNDEAALSHDPSPPSRTPTPSPPRTLTTRSMSLIMGRRFRTVGYSIFKISSGAHPNTTN